MSYVSRVFFSLLMNLDIFLAVLLSIISYWRKLNMEILSPTMDELLAPPTNGLPQQNQQEEEEEEDDESAYNDSKRRLKSMRHPDVVYISYVEEPSASDIEQKRNKLEEPENQWQDGSEDSDYVGSDEEIWVPSKSRWLALCLAIWGAETDADLIYKVKASKLILDIFTDGVFSGDGNSGCGAIIRDNCQRPIVARSKVNTKGEYVSPFLLQLEGIALGVALAKKYNASRFYLYCPSEDVCEFINASWTQRCMLL
ncbi:uncharacterized protein LOC113293448 [Papaver somniferum]|uniref:uncharacterized protein LOC113293448 n=1 Tax=Papaver somniferum TaxID=3469 RepID=UPI000E6F95B3|nr:uncharacterized protein LOC113293448 [Papaver somniferum]